MSIRDRAAGFRWNVRKAAVRLSNARYRAARPLRTLTGRAGNWRRRRFLETGRGFALERATRGVRSSLPVYRDRINPATGRPRADDREVYRRRDAALTRMREDRLPARAALVSSREPAQRTRGRSR